MPPRRCPRRRIARTSVQFVLGGPGSSPAAGSVFQAAISARSEQIGPVIRRIPWRRLRYRAVFSWAPCSPLNSAGLFGEPLIGEKVDSPARGLDSPRSPASAADFPRDNFYGILRRRPPDNVRPSLRSRTPEDPQLDATRGGRSTSLRPNVIPFAGRRGLGVTYAVLLAFRGRTSKGTSRGMTER